MDTYYSEEMLDKFEKFKQGCYLIFKKWQAFRIALDNNPDLLTVYADEERTELEIYSTLRVLLSDIDDEINKIKSKAVINMIGEMLYDFIQAYFQIEIEDKSEFHVARDIYELHGDVFKEGKFVFLEKLKLADKELKSSFSIDFPITKKSVQTKLLEAKMQKMDLDDEDGSDTGSEEKEENVSSSNANIMSDNNTGNTNNKGCVLDADGFMEIKKSKGKKANNKNYDLDVEMDLDCNNKKEDESLPDADGFVQVKKSKKKK